MGMIKIAFKNKRVEYFKQTYNYSVKYGRLICVKLSNTRDVVVPIEVLDVKPGQFYKKRLSAAETAQAIQFSTQKLSDVFAYNDSDFLRFSGMKIGSMPMVIPGRTLPALKIRKSVEFRDVISWAVILTGKQVPVRCMITSIHFAVLTVMLIGMRFPSSKPPFIQARPQGNYESLEEQFENAYRLAGETYKEKATFILVILPDFVPEVITAVNFWNLTYGLQNQYAHRRRQIGILVNLSRHEVFERVTDYGRSTSVQESRVEGIIGLGDMMAHAISMFNRYHQNVFKQNDNPLRIIFYRDGLSEGEFEVVAREEIKIIKKVFQKTKIDAELVYIVVGKRHHIRFFPPSGIHTIFCCSGGVHETTAFAGEQFTLEDHRMVRDLKHHKLLYLTLVMLQAFRKIHPKMETTIYWI
ncbi:Piwi domain-containing protein [Hysterangium stoloniferum]|nr:Piwi domain-containing protein [Hysterangium stoloniferum]